MKQVIIKSILANNFKGVPFKEMETIKDFTLMNLEKNGLVVLSGPNGYGKTTIFDIVEILFSKKITRFNSTRHGSRGFKDNGLLNNINKNGFIGIELETTGVEQRTFTIMGVIKNEKSNGELANNVEKILLYYKNSGISNDDVIHFQENELSLNKDFISINSSNEIEYLKSLNPNVFNLFYYISQEESTHFLKVKENEKLNKLDKMVDIDDFVAREDILTKMTTGGNKYRIDTLISEKDALISDKVKLYKSAIAEVKPENYARVFENIENIEWDIEIEDNDKLEVFMNSLSEIESIRLLLQNNIEFKQFSNKRILNKFLDKKDTIKNFLIFYNNNLIDFDSKTIDDNRMKLAIKKYTDYEKLNSFREVFDKEDYENTLTYELYVKTHKYFDLDGIVNKEDFDKDISVVKNANGKLGNMQRILNEFIEHREKMVEKFSVAIGSDANIIDSEICPMCGTNFINEDKELLDEINLMTKSLEKVCDEEISSVRILRAEFKKSFETILNLICKIDLNDRLTSDIYNEVNKVNVSAVLSKNLNEVIFTSIALGSKDLLKSDFEDAKTLETALTNKIGDVSDDFVALNKSHDFTSIYKKYFKNNRDVFSTICSDSDEVCSKLNKKINYIKYKEYLHLLSENKILHQEIYDMVKELIQLEDTKMIIEELKGIYVEQTKIFRDDLIKKIEVPLYLYTGKILQNYQRGLGVFIKNSKNVVNFVPDMKSDHEIINSFSSGQLSGFVIAFMIVMNKVYTTNDNSLNSIFIDDPVQTMDDINIASLVEVFRNEFGDKQIFMSTHEISKANYIMYKFSKHNIDYEYFDVKSII